MTFTDRQLDFYFIKRQSKESFCNFIWLSLVVHKRLSSSTDSTFVLGPLTSPDDSTFNGKLWTHRLRVRHEVLKPTGPERTGTEKDSDLPRSGRERVESVRMKWLAGLGEVKWTRPAAISDELTALKIKGWRQPMNSAGVLKAPDAEQWADPNQWRPTADS